MTDQTKPDPAASMSLLTRVIDSSLDPGYAKAKAESDQHRQKERSVFRKALVLFACVALMWFATVSAKNLYVASVKATPTADALSEQVEIVRVSIDSLVEENAALEAQVLEHESAEEVFDNQDVTLKTASGSTKVVGPGLVVTITDNFGGGATPLIQDSDIRTLLNALWSGGAEAVAIDGLRVGAQTTVRTAGASILVNLQPISSPYVIEAIGDPVALQSSLSTGAAGSAVKNLEDSLGMTISSSSSKELIFPAVPATQLWYATENVSNEETGDDRK